MMPKPTGKEVAVLALVWFWVNVAVWEAIKLLCWGLTHFPWTW